MIYRPFVFLLVTFGLLAGSAAGDGLTVEADPENVVASRLEGSWRGHAALTQRLTGKSPAGPATISFTIDPSVAGRVSDKYAGAFRERKLPVYLAGRVKLNDKAYPFVLTQISGNPHVFFWLPRDEDPFGNGESFNVMLAVADEPQDDLLFTGGDFNNQPFSAFERIPADVAE